MQGERMRRVNEGVREVVSSALTTRARDERLGFVTITGVETSPDLRHATVFVSVFGPESEREGSFEVLEDMRPALQREIATHLRMKNTPKLKFEYDDSVDRGMRVTQLLTNDTVLTTDRDSAPGPDQIKEDDDE